TDHGTEYFFAGDAVAALNVGEDGRLDEVAVGKVAVWSASAGDGAGTGTLALVEVAEDALLLVARDERAHLRLGIEPVAEAKRFGHRGQARDEIVVNRFLDEQPRTSGADLALAEVDAHEHALEGGIKVGVCEDDVRALAAEFQRHLLQVARRRDHEQPADLGR